MISLEIPGLPEMYNKMKNWHWAKKAKHNNKWKELVFWHLKSKNLVPPSPYSKALITLTRCSAAMPDLAENLPQSFKPVLDGLKDAGIIIDDSSKYVELSYGWEKAKALHGHIRIQVKDLST